MEEPIGVVHDHRFSILHQELVICPAHRGDGLPEGGTVLEGEPLSCHELPEPLPLRTPAPLVPLIHEDQVLLSELLDVHRDPLSFLLLGELMDVRDPDLVPVLLHLEMTEDCS